MINRESLENPQSIEIKYIHIAVLIIYPPYPLYSTQNFCQIASKESPKSLTRENLHDVHEEMISPLVQSVHPLAPVRLVSCAELKHLHTVHRYMSSMTTILDPYAYNHIRTLSPMSISNLVKSCCPFLPACGTISPTSLKSMVPAGFSLTY